MLRSDGGRHRSDGCRSRVCRQVIRLGAGNGNKGLHRIKTNLEKEQAKGRKSQQETDAVFSRISPAELTEAGDADFIIEAIAENKKQKRNCLTHLIKSVPSCRIGKQYVFSSYYGACRGHKKA